MANPSASFAIDIAAQMTDGDQTIAELDALSAELMGAGKDAAFFQDAILSVSGELKAASQAAAEANAALSAGNAEYSDLERAAAQAARSVQKLQLSGNVMSRQFFDAVDASDAASKALADQAGTLRGLEAAADGANKKEAQLGSTLRNVEKLSGHVNKTIAGQAQALEKLGGSLGAVGGPLGTLGQSIVRPLAGFAKLSSEMGTARAAALLGVVGFVAVAAAIVAVGVAAAAAAIKVATWAVGLADSARSAGLATEAFEAMNPALAGLPFDAVSKATGQTRAELQTLAKSLASAGVAAEDLPGALRAAALAEAALGKGGSADFLARIKDGKEAVRDLASETQSKLGGIVSKQLLGIEAQSERLGSEFRSLFSGLNIEPVIAAMQVLVGLFDQSSEAGKTVKWIFETVFQPIIDQAENAAYVVEAFYLGFLIGSTKLYIAIKPLIKAVSELFGFEGTQLSDVLNLAKNAGEILAYVFAGLVGAFALVVISIGAVVAAFGAVLYIPILVKQAFDAVLATIAETLNAAINFIKGLDLATVGSDLIAGLVRGILGGAGAVVSAITGAVGGAINAAKSMLGIASPSKVFEDIGLDTGAGMVGGVDESAADVSAAMTDMVDPPVAAMTAEVEPPIAADDSSGGALGAGVAGAPGAAGASSGAAGMTVQFNAPVTFNGVKDGPSGAKQLSEWLMGELEAMAASGGGAAGAEASA